MVQGRSGVVILFGRNFQMLISSATCQRVQWKLEEYLDRSDLP